MEPILYSLFIVAVALYCTYWEQKDRERKEKEREKNFPNETPEA